MTFILVDKAGFLRRVESLYASNSVGDAMLRIGNITPKLEVGTAAPDFSMVDFKGRIFRLADLRNQKNVLLTFFPKCFTGGCTNHLSSLRDLQDDFDANDVQIIAISVDPAEGDKGQRAYAEHWGFKFPFIPDTGRNLSLLYRAVTTTDQLSSRQSILIDKDGIVRWIDDKVNVHTHGADILAKMRELQIIK